MNVKQLRKIVEKLDDALSDVECDLDNAAGERDFYAFQLEEKTEEMEQMEAELRFLCQVIFDARVKMPQRDHFIDINPYVSKLDPCKGKYEYGWTGD